MSESNEEVSESGQPIYRHKPREKPFVPATGDELNIQHISDHIEKHIGEVDSVFHEIVSDLVHIDIHLVKPTAKRNWITLVTSGMSDRPMTVPPDGDALRYAELMLCLPPDWPLDEESMKDDRNFWPIRWLKMLARLPHEYDTWLGWGHTVPNGDPPEPIAENTKFCCMLLLSPVLADDGFERLALPDRVINVYSVVPLYKEEVEFKLAEGTEKLIDHFAATHVNELVRLTRPNVCARKKRWWQF